MNNCGILGINHKSADLVLRESISRICQKRFGNDSLHADFSFVLLSTCNRTEIYFSSFDSAETHSYLLNVLRNDLDSSFEHHIYSYFGRDCFLHLASVTSGMDSALIGETEIQGQVKTAYEAAITSRFISRELHYLFQKSLKIGKEIRSQPKKYELPTIEETIFNASTQIIGPLKEKRILIIGLSEINQKILKHFKKKELNNITLCNRTFEKIKEVVKEENISQLRWDEFPRWVDFDLIIIGTKAPDYLIDEAREVIKRRVIVDLSVPRNVDPKVGRHPQITLLNVDQLTLAIDRKRKIKAEEIARKEKKIIAHLIDKQIELFRLKENFREALQVS